MSADPPPDPSAFAHPEARARALRGPVPRDRILLRGHVVAAEIGAFQPERGRTQRLRFDAAVEVAPPAGPTADDVDRILSYDRITEAIAAELAAERLNLLETLAERVATRILAAPQAERVFLRVEKLDLGPHAKGVEIVRARPAVAEPAAQAAPPAPLVVHLDAATVTAADLPARLTEWQGQGAPLILTVGFPDAPRPATGHAPTARRIALLAIEQQAWVLAARDPRCVVVATRTEIDWALRQGGSVVWAPGKMALDSPDAPRGADPLALTGWLARLFGARAVLVHGADTLPADPGCPVIRA
jgi:dihydroneopterin aldolase